MNIAKVHLQNLLNTGTNQYVIPFFQRPYVWSKDDCENLYEDIMETLEFSKTNPNKEHFIGTIITKSSATSSQMTAQFHLVDGQQRLTTFSLLLKALANSVDLTQPKANFLYTNINSTLHFMDSYGDIHFRIKHNRIDGEYFEKVMGADGTTSFDEPEGKSRIVDAYRFFKGKFDGLSNEIILAINQTVLNKFPAISMVLDQHDDEQEIFDTINSLGVKLTTSELLKNFIFSDSATQKLYGRLWEDVFESDEETIRFWNSKKTAGRVYRENIDVLLYCYLLNVTEKEVSLEHLFKEYKDWLSSKGAAEKQEFLESLKAYAEIFAAFPTGKELHNLKFEDREKRFFHVIENLNITTIYPLVLFLYKELGNSTLLASCLDLLESYLVRRSVCRLTTKNYNNLFVSIVKSIKSSEAPNIFEALTETLYSGAEDTNRFPSDDEFKTGIMMSQLSNQHAKEFLFAIALFQVKVHLNDVTVLSSHSFSVEHMMPKAWHQNWPLVDDTERAKIERNAKLLTLGNLTIITKNLNSKLRNSAWGTKRSTLAQYSSIPLTTAYTSLSAWDEASIDSRGRDLVESALLIWKMA